MMRRDAEDKYQKGSKQYARAMRDILLIIWLLTLPLRQRNISESRLGRREDGANIFKAGISDLPTIARPKWVIDELRQNSGLEVWQFRFGPRETKTGNLIHGILPKQIAAPLEEYLKNFRPLLVSGADPGTVFLTESGQPFTRATLEYHVENATFRYFGRRVNPHLFRDIFAVKFLEENPENYLTLSKILWHKHLYATFNLYGRYYDESHGGWAAERWLEQRKKKKPK
jgi:integrase